jgi:hypothetical protein
VFALGLAFAENCPAQVPRGGEMEIAAIATGEERTAQSDLYVMDVWAKPMRMIAVEVTDPKTGDKKLDYVWYIVYRAFNRKLARPTYDKPPENTLDPEVITPPLFVPEFTLVTTDTEVPLIYQDQIIPEALPLIQKREKGKYLDTVDAVGPIPAPSEPGEPDREGIWGVAMWRGIDPKADDFTVYMTGFSNGIRKTDGPDGQPVIQTKTIMQKYWRPGDEFDLAEPEMRLKGVAQWIYR